jgi:hypothetical protein
MAAYPNLEVVISGSVGSGAAVGSVGVGVFVALEAGVEVGRSVGVGIESVLAA